MHHILTPLAALTLTATAALASDATPGPVQIWQEDPTTVFDARDVDLSDFKWQARPIVVFGEGPLDPVFGEQMDLLLQDIDRLVERDVVLIVDTDEDTPSDLRTQLRPRSFMMVLIGKDGQVKLRKPFPWDVRELSRSIDKMPIREREIRDARRAE